jgi:hypothetical protein
VVHITHRPVAQRPAVHGAHAEFTTTHISATGHATLGGDPGDAPAGWQLGFIQVELIETNWAYYRGKTKHDGSVFVQRARAPARPQKAYRDDDDPHDVFYDEPGASAPAGAHPPVALAIDYLDQPADGYPVSRQNGITHAPNLLHEVQIELLFCTILSTRDPAGVYRHLKHFYWNVRWQATFTPSTFNLAAGPHWVVVPTAGGNGASVSHVFDGPPHDPRFMNILVAPQQQNANQAVADADAHPIVTESPTWRRYVVTQ